MLLLGTNLKKQKQSVSIGTGILLHYYNICFYKGPLYISKSAPLILFMVRILEQFFDYDKVIITV